MTVSFSSLLFASSGLAEPRSESSVGKQEKVSDKSKVSKDKLDTKEPKGFFDRVFDGTWIMDSSPGCEYGLVSDDQNAQ